MVILGVDPALKITGFGAISYEDRRFRLLTCGVIETRSSQPLPERLKALYCSITGIISSSKPQVMVLEKVYVHHQHKTTAFLLGEARGSIAVAASSSSIPVEEYAATQVKKALTGSGHATKQQVQSMVCSILNMDKPGYLDITDALALAICYCYHNRTSALSGILARYRR